MMPHRTCRQSIPCPYCLSRSDFYFHHYSRRYFHCPSCDLIFLYRMPSSADMASYYKNRYYDDYADDQGQGPRLRLNHHVLDLIEKWTEPGRLLDVGCGCGFFLTEAKKRGWEIIGLDPSIKSIHFARKLIGEFALLGTLDDLPGQMTFRAITLINVLDHMSDAWTELERVRNRLNRDGMLYLRFPNGRFHASVARVFSTGTKRQIVNSFLVFHEYAFTSRFIKRCLSDLGFLNIRIRSATVAGTPFWGQKGAPVMTLVYNVETLVAGIFRMLDTMSGGRWLWGPSLEITAKGYRSLNI